MVFAVVRVHNPSCILRRLKLWELESTAFYQEVKPSVDDVVIECVVSDMSRIYRQLGA